MTALARFAELLHLEELALSVVRAAIFLVPFTLAIALIEGRSGANQARYKTRNFLNDVLYSLFYRGAFYQVLIFAAVANGFESQLAFLRLDLLAEAPLAVALAVFWIGGDFVLYWVHRLQHRVPALWAFHSVHHGQSQLTTLSQYRRHPLEKVMLDVVLLVGFAMVLGVPTRTWVPLYVAMMSLQALQHAELGWTFGPFYRFVVSPVFHSVHHSTDPAHYNRNFGQMFSVWDYLFGTAAGQRVRAARYGVDGLDMPESISSQLLSPFRQIRDHYATRLRSRRETARPGQIRS